MVSNSSPKYFLELIKWEREGDITPVINSHISAEFLEATCQDNSPAGCADCGYSGDLFSPTHLQRCAPQTGATTAPNGHATTEDFWWTSQNADEAWVALWDEDPYEDDKREVDTFTADVRGDYDE